MNDSRAAGLQFAILELMIKNNPELKDEILKRAEFYTDTFFTGGS